MRKIITISLLLLMCTSCANVSLLPKTNTKKEIRRSRKFNKKLAKLIAKYPEFARGDSTIMKINIRTPKIKSRILVPAVKFSHAQAAINHELHTTGHIPTQPFSQYFEDENLIAKVAFDGKNFTLDYTIMPMAIDTNIRAPTINIERTIYRDIPNDKNEFLIRSGIILWIIVIAGAVFIIIKFITVIRK